MRELLFIFLHLAMVAVAMLLIVDSFCFVCALFKTQHQIRLVVP